MGGRDDKVLGVEEGESKYSGYIRWEEIYFQLMEK